MSVTIPVTTGPQTRLPVVTVRADQWATTIDLVVSDERGRPIGWVPMSPEEADLLIDQLTAAKASLTMWADSALTDFEMDQADADTLARVYTAVTA